MHYLLLFAAITLEIIATTLLKYSAGFTKLWPSLGSVALSKALNSINLGVAYATWCAGGIVVTTIISALLFGQKLNMIGIAGIVLIVAGCIIVNLFGTTGE